MGSKVRLSDNPRLTCKISPKVLNHIQVVAEKRFPNFQISFSLSTDGINFHPYSGVFPCLSSDLIYIKIKIQRPWNDDDYIFTSIANDGTNRYTLIPNLQDPLKKKKEESGWALLSHQRSVIILKKFPVSSWVKCSDNRAELEFTLYSVLPKKLTTTGKNIILKLLIISDMWIGSDQEFEISVSLLDTIAES